MSTRHLVRLVSALIVSSADLIGLLYAGLACESFTVKILLRAVSIFAWLSLTATLTGLFNVLTVRTRLNKHSK